MVYPCRLLNKEGISTTDWVKTKTTIKDLIRRNDHIEPVISNPVDKRITNNRKKINPRDNPKAQRIKSNTQGISHIPGKGMIFAYKITSHTRIYKMSLPRHYQVTGYNLVP